mgnify:CR=1 FL=1
MSRLLLVIATVLLSVFSFAVQQDDSWSIRSVMPVDALVRESGHVGGYAFSEAANMIAWIDWRDLCLYSRLSKLTRCYRVPYDPWRLSWSPDGNAILLMAGNNIYNAYLQVFDLRSERFTLLEGDHWVSASGFWSGSGETIYFLSVGWRGTNEENPFLVAYSLRTQTYTRTDLGGIFPAQTKNEVKLEAVSPDGESLIISVPYDYVDGASLGLWMIDIGARRLKQIAPMRDLYSLLPECYYEPSNSDIMDVYWNQERGALWVMIGRGLPSRPIGVVSIDLETFEQTPLVPVRFYSASDSSDIISYPSGHITPNGALFFYLQESSFDKWYLSSLYAIPLDSPGAEPLLVIDPVTPDCIPEFVLVEVEHQQQVHAYLADYSHFCPG